MTREAFENAIMVTSAIAGSTNCPIHLNAIARHVGVDPSTVSNWENDKDPIGPASDRLLRLMVAHGAPVDDYSLEELTKIENEQKPPIEVRVSPKAKGWEHVQAA
jgi:transcriptional regulator with XRE-family HTH domain